MAKADLTDEPAAEPSWRVIHRIADRNRPRVKRAIVQAIRETLGETTTADIEAALDSGDLDRVMRAVPWDTVAAPKLKAYLTESLGEIASDAGLATRRFTPQLLGASLDLLNDKAVEWAAQHSAQLVTAVGDETKAAIRSIVAEGFSSGIPPKDLGRMIRPVIGLTERQARAVVTYGLDLMAGGTSVADAERLMQKYAEKSLRFRAEMIARTETLTASNKGQELDWEAAAEEGLLNTSELYREWITTPDDRLCDLCAAQDGLQARIGEPFALRAPAEGFVDTPTEIHPMCRCAEGLAERRTEKSLIRKHDTLYVRRPVLNAVEIVGWAVRSGIERPLQPDDLHVTVVYSRYGKPDLAPDTRTLYIEPGTLVGCQKLGTLGATVLIFRSSDLEARHAEAGQLGASWDYDAYRPHVTLSYDQSAPLPDTPPFGLLLGPEIHEPVEDGWADAHALKSDLVAKPLPSPRDDESEDDFMGRCMGQAVMVHEYSEPAQRAAVCHRLYQQREQT